MKRILTALMVAFTLLFMSGGMSFAQDLQKGLEAEEKGDYATAFQIFRALAEQGDADAQYFLGWMYYKGQGVLQDYKKAVEWNRKSAEQGEANAQFALGAAYALGRGVIQDNVYAHMWWNIATSNGLSGADMSRDDIAKQMTPSQIAEAQKLARECVRKQLKGC